MFLLLILKHFLECGVANPWHSTAWPSQAPLVVCSFPVGSGQRLPHLCGLFSLCHPDSLFKLEPESSSARKDRAHCISKAEALLALLLQLQPMDTHWVRLRGTADCLPYSLL